MTALSDLFPDGPRAGQSGSAVLDDRHTARRLREMIGESRRDDTSPRALADTRELVQRVDTAARTAVPVAVRAEVQVRPRRRARRRIDALALSAAAVAVVAVATAATVGGVQMATASPASSAMESLEAEEAIYQNAHQALTSARNRLVADIDAQTAEIAQLRSTLTETATVPDPAAVSDPAMLAVADPSTLAQAIDALDAYQAGLAALTIPELPADYNRVEINEESLVSVGAAIDDVQGRSVALGDAATALRGQRTQLDALRQPAESAVSAYASSFVPAAAAANDRYPDAEEPLRTAVTEAASLVSASVLWAADSRELLAAYGAALTNLAADQLRFEIARQESQRLGQQNGSQTPPVNSSTDPNPADPTDPVDPVDQETPPAGDTTP